jgi:hypothetical protein
VKISFEEVVTDYLWRYGPVVAVGRPGEGLPPLGAARDYWPDKTWQEKVQALLEEAPLIFVVVGRTTGVAWEIGKIVELGLVRKLVLLLPPLRARELRARWDYLCERLSEAQALGLRRDVDLSRTRAVVFPTGQGAHMITATNRDDWTYETVIDAAAELNALGTREPASAPLDSTAYSHSAPLGAGSTRGP